MLLAKQCFCEIKKYIRFDLRSTRSERIKEDKFCMMSFFLNRFAEDSQKSFAPAESLTATRKTAKYSSIQAHHIFQPVAVESLGPINASGRIFLSKLGRKLADQSGDDREISFLF